MQVGTEEEPVLYVELTNGCVANDMTYFEMM